MTAPATSATPTIGLCMIVKDEEANLRNCLESVRGIFDQIVIVDTGSKDKTKEVALSFGAEVHDFQWINDFAAARNFSFSKCRCDFVSWLDGDDIVKPDSRQLWLNLKPKLNTCDAYMMSYDYAQDEHGNSLCSLHRHRIVRNTGEVKWRWPIHECMQIPPHWQQSVTNIVVTHRRTAADNERDKGRNIKMLKEAVRQEPTEPRLKFYLAKECFSEGMYEDAIVGFLDYFKTGKDWHDNMVNGRFLLAMSYLNTGKEDLGIEQCLEGIKLDPRWAEFYNTIGQIHYNHGRWGQAIPWFEIATHLTPPQTFGTVLTDNYTWIPGDRLCMCYSNVGRIYDAYLANEKAIGYRQNDPRIKFNREFIRDTLFTGRKSERPIRLSLGSGGKHTLSYRCTDLYLCPGVEEVFDQGDIPYHSASVHAIYSEHALEHSAGHKQAEGAVAEWARVLRHGGHLLLKLPDLELCCAAFLRAEDRAANQNERWSEKDWYRYTIYGIQQGQNKEPDDGQYHRTGFTKGGIKRLLEKNGFEVKSVENYDGYGTPSIAVEAVQVRQPVKVCWMMPGPVDENHGSQRIRRLKVHQWLQAHGVDSRIMDYESPDPATGQRIDPQKVFDTVRFADVCVFISFGPREREMIDRLRRHGVKIIYDHCEDLHDLPSQRECFGMADTLVCCSTLLAQKAQVFARAVAIPDAYEVA